MARNRDHFVPVLLAALLALAGPTPVERLAVAQRNDGDAAGERADRDGRGGRRERGPEGRPAETPASVSKPAADSPTNFGTQSNEAKFAKSASDMIKANDKNGDGILEGDEFAKLGMSKRADANGDGKITQPELVAYYRGLSQPAAAKSTSSPASSQPKTAGAEATSEEPRKLVNKKRKSYRFKSTKERLKTWKFASKDTNGDGQVSMSEYSRVWSDRTAAEFQRYDLDHDGMITSKEAR